MGVTVGETLEFYYAVFEAVTSQEKFHRTYDTEAKLIKAVSEFSDDRKVRSIYSADENGKTREKSISLINGRLQLVDVKHCEEGPDPAFAYTPEPLVTPWTIQQKGENE